MTECKYCKKETKNKIYCSVRCKCIDLSVTNKFICDRCKKEFIVTYTKNRNVRYCSNECRFREYNINKLYFSTLTPEKIIILGMINVIGYVYNYKTITLVSNQSTLEYISNILESTYPMRKTDRGLYRVDIICSEMVSDLVMLGICNNPMYQDLVPYDFDLLLIGIQKTHIFHDNSYVLESHRIGMELCDRLGMVMSTKVYKSMSIGREFIDYVLT